MLWYIAVYLALGIILAEGSYRVANKPVKIGGYISIVLLWALMLALLMILILFGKKVGK